MKKIFVLVAFAVITMFSGLMLSSCGQGDYLIHITLNEPNLVYARVEADGKELEANSSGKFHAENLDKVRVFFFATQDGVNLVKNEKPAIQVTVNGKNAEVFPYKVNGNVGLCFGYINLFGQTKDVELVVSGAESVHSNFEFNLKNGTSETSQKRIATAEIKFPDDEDFQSLATFLAQEDKTFSADFLGQENFETNFQMRFVGGNPYKIQRNAPFVLKENPQNEDFEEIPFTYSNGIYTFNLGERETGKTYTIEADFDKLECNQFVIKLPENQTYSTEVGSGLNFLTYESKTTIKVKKSMADVEMNEAEVQAFLDTTKLDRDPEAQDGEGEMTFLLPEGLTPSLTGGSGDEYVFRITGIKYGDKQTHKVSAESKETHPAHFINPEIYVLDGEGNADGAVGFDDDGNQITFEGSTNVLAWEYQPYQLGRTEAGEDEYTYRTPYDLSDYNLKLNGETLFNIKDVLDQEKAKPEYEEGQEIVHSENGFELKATQSTAGTNTYDSFTLQFQATEDMEFTFEDFQLFKKKVNFGFDFDLEDKDVTKVECFVGTLATDLFAAEWHELQDTSARWENQEVEFGNVVFFRLQVSRDKKDGDFRISSKTEDNSWYDPERVTIDNKNYIIYKFGTTDLHWDEVQDVLLVSTDDFFK